MKFLVILAFLGFVSSEYTTFNWKSCTTDKVHQALRVNSVSVSPMPLVTPGPLHISFDADVLQRIDLAILNFTLTRHTALGANVHVPCIGTLGSCPLDGCSVVDDLRNGSREAQRDLGRQLKAMFDSIGIFKSCPIQIQHVAVTNYTINIPALSSAVNFIADGDYTVKVDVREPVSSSSLGCFEFNASIKRAKTSGFLFG
uniref:Putative ganglioside GM2 activator-like protein n=1 Tax=Pinctada fucata TaxID=50426 RepID=A0A194AL83_PINFU